jgi:ubiquinone/menaquinone biosynthesis C-methylase UbiE
MTKPLRAAIELIIGCIDEPGKILEVGSRQAINQNDLADFRGMFNQNNFTGLDMQKGPGVDVVASAENIPFPDKSFDLIICLETLEHTEKPWVVCSEIERVIKPNGVAIVSSQQNFPIHMHPSDYFRYTPYGLKALFPKFSNKLIFAISPPFDDEVKLNPQHIVLVGSILNSNKLHLKIKKTLQRNINKISVHKPYSHRINEVGRLIKRAINELSFRQEIEFFK